METPTEKAMDALKESMVQMRHDAVEEIQDGMRQYIHDLAHNLFEKFIIVDRQTGQPIGPEELNLIQPISDSEWYQHEILELLKCNEDDALEQMTWIVEPKSAPEGCAPEDRFDSFRHLSVPLTRPPVGRDQHMSIIEDLGRSVPGQEDVLRKAFEYLQTVPDVVNEELLIQEAVSIAKVRHLLNTKWVRETLKADDLFKIFMKGRGTGVDERDMGILQQQAANMDTS